MRLKYNVSDLEKMANREGEELELWLIDHPEYVTEDGVIYFEYFKKTG